MLDYKYSIEAKKVNKTFNKNHSQVDALVDFNIVDNSNNSETMIYNATFNLTFNDNPSQNNYYRIRLFLHTVGQEDEEVDEFIEKSYPIILYSNDPSLSQGIPWDGYTFSGRTALFSDDLFNGEQKSISFDMEYKLSGIEYGDSLFLQVTSFSEDGYKYFNSLERNRDRFISPFGTEPVPVYSNVNNGIGIFSSRYTYNFDSIGLTESTIDNLVNELGMNFQ